MKITGIIIGFILGILFASFTANCGDNLSQSLIKCEQEKTLILDYYGQCLAERSKPFTVVNRS